MKREWGAAREKIAAEGGRCRVCRRTTRYSDRRIEAAHIIGREADRLMPLTLAMSGLAHEWPEPYLVMPVRIVPLCGPATDPTTCHGKQHAGRLDLIPCLTLPEVLQAVHDASRLFGGNGFESARVRLMPTNEREVVGRG